MTIDKKLIPTLRFPQFSGEWEVKRLGDVLTFGSGRDYKHLGVGDIPVYGTGGVMTFVDDYLYDGDSIGIGRKGTINKPVFLSGKFWSVDTLFYTHSFINLDVLFAYNYFLKVNWLKYNEASGVPSLSKSTLQTIKISLPTTLPEQEKIASFLSSIDRKVELLKAKKEQLEQYKKGMMQQLFAQTIRFKDQNGKQFPEWQEKRLGEIGRIITGSTPLTSKKEYYNGEIMFVSPGDVSENKYICNTSKHISKEGLGTCRVVKKGSIAFVGIGSIGKVGIVEQDCATNQQLHAITCDSTINTDYVYYTLLYNAKKIARIAPIQVMPILNKTEFSNLIYILPSLPEQQKIADFLSAIDRKIEGVGQQMAQTELFKKAMLQQLFV